MTQIEKNLLYMEKNVSQEDYICYISGQIPYSPIDLYSGQIGRFGLDTTAAVNTQYTLQSICDYGTVFLLLMYAQVLIPK